MEIIKKSWKMQELNKIGIDLLFCLIIGFLIVKASNSARQNEDISNIISIESDRISAASLSSN